MKFTKDEKNSKPKTAQESHKRVKPYGESYTWEKERRKKEKKKKSCTHTVYKK